MGLAQRLGRAKSNGEAQPTPAAGAAAAFTTDSREDMASIGQTLRRRNMYLSANDAGRFFCCAVETDRLPKPGVEVVYAQSRGEKPDGGLDREPARRLLGYEGKDVWPHGYPDLA